ncbi:MAG: glutamine amidotransferase family protein [Oscillospiraceae bacterium]|jgi:glutamate synthase domain-containing protein 1|nr:glutamine amidotransferase family protein [Oscillospiraceae bacterium]
MPIEGQVRIPSGCAIAGIFSRSGERMSGDDVIRSIAVMHDRSNGLGGGFAGYGIYPDYAAYYAFHLFYQEKKHPDAQQQCEAFLRRHFYIIHAGVIPTRKIPEITDEPRIWRYFVLPLPEKQETSQLDEQEFTARCALRINAEIEGAFVFSGGKNMGVFKGIGYPEDVGRFYRLEEYGGYSWTAHGRYPTNTPGWWGGAHPFGLLDCTVVHNGEISSYDANRRFIEMFNYQCTLQTDTEVITYIIDYLHRKQGLSLEETAAVVSAPFWSTLEEMPEPDRSTQIYLRKRFSNLLITGPFSIILGFEGGQMVLGDRLKLRGMVVGNHGDRFYAASEECAIRAVCPDIAKVWSPEAGEPVIVTMDRKEAAGTCAPR